MSGLIHHCIVGQFFSDWSNLSCALSSGLFSCNIIVLSCTLILNSAADATSNQQQEPSDSKE